MGTLGSYSLKSFQSSFKLYLHSNKSAEEKRMLISTFLLRNVSLVSPTHRPIRIDSQPCALLVRSGLFILFQIIPFQGFLTVVIAKSGIAKIPNPSPELWL